MKPFFYRLFKVFTGRFRSGFPSDIIILVVAITGVFFQGHSEKSPGSKNCLILPIYLKIHTANGGALIREFPLQKSSG